MELTNSEKADHLNRSPIVIRNRMTARQVILNQTTAKKVDPKETRVVAAAKMFAQVTVKDIKLAVEASQRLELMNNNKQEYPVCHAQSLEICGQSEEALQQESESNQSLIHKFALLQKQNRLIQLAREKNRLMKEFASRESQKMYSHIHIESESDGIAQSHYQQTRLIQEDLKEKVNFLTEFARNLTMQAEREREQADGFAAVKQDAYDSLQRIVNEIKQHQDKKQKLAAEVSQIQERMSLNQVQINSIRFYTYVIRYLLAPTMRTAFIVYKDAAPNILMDYSSWRPSNHKKVDLEEIKYYIVCQLYPRYKQFMSKLSYTCVEYRCLLKAEPIDGMMLQNMIQRMPKNESVTDMNGTEPKKPLRTTACQIVIGDQKNYENTCQLATDIISTIVNHLSGFNNSIIRINEVWVEDSTQFPELLREIKIKYTYLNGPELTKKIHLITLRPQLVNPEVVGCVLASKGKKCAISDLLEYLGQPRSGYVLVRIPTLYKKNDEKLFMGLYDLMKKDYY